MPASVVTATRTRGPFKVGRTVVIYGTIAWSGAGGTYTTGGNTLSFQNVVTGAGSKKPPLAVLFTSTGGATTSQFEYVYINGTTLANGKVKIFCATSASSNIGCAEHTAATTHADVLTDVIPFKLELDALL